MCARGAHPRGYGKYGAHRQLKRNGLNPLSAQREDGHEGAQRERPVFTSIEARHSTPDDRAQPQSRASQRPGGTCIRISPKQFAESIYGIRRFTPSRPGRSLIHSVCHHIESYSNAKFERSHLCLILDSLAHVSNGELYLRILKARRTLSTLHSRCCNGRQCGGSNCVILSASF